jgi:hypothetical protein
LSTSLILWDKCITLSSYNSRRGCVISYPMLCIRDMNLIPVGFNTVLESCNLHMRHNERVIATLSLSTTFLKCSNCCEALRSSEAAVSDMIFQWRAVPKKQKVRRQFMLSERQCHYNKLFRWQQYVFFCFFRLGVHLISIESVSLSWSPSSFC